MNLFKPYSLSLQRRTDSRLAALADSPEVRHRIDAGVDMDVHMSQVAYYREEGKLSKRGDR